MVTQQELIIKELGVKPFINPLTEFRTSVNFLKNYLKKYNKLYSLVLGISGGQDSTLTGKICQQAINEIRSDTNKKDYKFIAVRLPYGKQKDEMDCRDVINFIQPDCLITINIKDAIQASEIALFKSGIYLKENSKGNEKARERMKMQYSIANTMSGLVIGTCHAAEAVTGFFTKYGDGGTDINPLFRLNKRQGQTILRYLNCPKHLYLKIPTADLEDQCSLIPDETLLGITYDIIDDYLEGKSINVADACKIEHLYYCTKHKRRVPLTVLDDI